MVTLKLGEIVIFADESVFVEHVQLFPGGQLFVAEDTGETFQMVDARPRSAN